MNFNRVGIFSVQLAFLPNVLFVPVPFGLLKRLLHVNKFRTRCNKVKRQRERFRKEALRRERETSIVKGNAEQLARDNQELRKENIHLYKRIRQEMFFLLSFIHVYSVLYYF